MVYERVHVRLHRLALGEHDLRRVGLGGAGAQAVEGLTYDPVRLDHLAHPHEVARPNVAALLDRDLEVVSLVARVRVDAPNVYGDAAPAQAGPRQPPVDGVLRRDDPDALRAVLEDAVARQQVVELL